MVELLNREEPKTSRQTPREEQGAVERVQNPANTSEMRRPAAIVRIMDIPTHTAVLSLPDGPVGLRAADQKVVAVLEVAKKKAAILWSGRTADAESRDAAKSRARLAGYEVIATTAASAEVIAFCHDQDTQIAIAQEQRSDELESSEATQEFDEILTQALALKATDIHLCPEERVGVVKIRVNGDLRDLRNMVRARMDAMIRAMYIQTEEDSRSGSTNFNADEYLGASLNRAVNADNASRNVKMRWASGPGVGRGHDVVIRILARDGEIKKLSALGWRKEQVEAMNEALRLPEGIILLVGITGSGKSTTIASSANEWLRRYAGRRSLRTIEDPVEIIIPGARHMSTPSTGKEGNLQGSEFGRALRTILRMDPDGIFVGEIRDQITADLTMQAQQTGHKVFATLHASSAFEAYTRLMRLGVDKRDLLGESAINLIAYQRLLPILCSSCSKSWDEVKDTLNETVRLEIEDQFEASLHNLRFRGNGCEECGNGRLKGDGAIGRQALAHLLVPDANFRHLMAEGHDMVAEAYWRGGMSEKYGALHQITLHDSARSLIRAGMLCPLDANMALGSFIDQTPPRESATWYTNHTQGMAGKTNHGR